jgi:hypothetical protein
MEMWDSISGVLGLPARVPLLLLILLYPSGQRIPIIQRKQYNKLLHLFFLVL